MLIDPAARGAGVADHEQLGDSGGVPASLSSDLPGEPSLAIERHEGRLDVRYHGFDLDDQQRAPGRVEGEDVDRAALPRR